MNALEMVQKELLGVYQQQAAEASEEFQEKMDKLTNRFEQMRAIAPEAYQWFQDHYTGELPVHHFKSFFYEIPFNYGETDHNQLFNEAYQYIEYQLKLPADAGMVVINGLAYQKRFGELILIAE
jgi:hypothetical protein